MKMNLQLHWLLLLMVIVLDPPHRCALLLLALALMAVVPLFSLFG
jgi:hypothetical protein